MPIFLEFIWYFREAVQFCNASFYSVMPKYGSPLGRTDFEQKAAFAIEGVQVYVESVANDDRIKIKTRKTVFLPIFLEFIWYFREAVQFCNASFYSVMPKYGSPIRECNTNRSNPNR